MKRVIRATMEALPWSELKRTNTRFGPRFSRWTRIDLSELEWYRSQKPRLDGLGIVIRHTEGTKDAFLVWWSKPPESKEFLEVSHQMSRSVDADVPIPVPSGLELRGFQKACVAFMLPRKATLIGDDMGVGKTVELIAYINAMNAQRRVLRRILVVVPPIVRINWARELEKWLCDRHHAVGIAMDEWPETDIVVVGYSMTMKFEREIVDTKWDLVVLDEAHNVANRKAKTTRVICGYVPKMKEDITLSKPGVTTQFRVAMTGTPIPNKIENIYSVLKWLDPIRWKDWGKFAFEHCGTGGFLSAQSVKANQLKLQTVLRSTIMIRREKKDVLTELPPVVRRLHIIPQDEVGGFGKLNREFEALMKSDWARGITAAKAKLEVTKCIGTDLQYERACREVDSWMKRLEAECDGMLVEVGLKKVPIVTRMVTEDYPSRRVFVLAYHIKVLEALQAAIPGSVMLNGSHSQAERQAAIDAYQRGEGPTVMIMQVGIAIGFTLTAAEVVLFCEGSWLPAHIGQAESRAHRMGKSNPVEVVWPVVENGIDMLQAQRVTAKQAVIDGVLNLNIQGGDTERETVIPQPGVTLLRSRVGTAASFFQSESALQRATEFARKLQDEAVDEVDREICRIVVGLKMTSQLAYLVSEIEKRTYSVQP